MYVDVLCLAMRFNPPLLWSLVWVLLLCQLLSATVSYKYCQLLSATVGYCQLLAATVGYCQLLAATVSYSYSQLISGTINISYSCQLL